MHIAILIMASVYNIISLEMRGQERKDDLMKTNEKNNSYLSSIRHVLSLIICTYV